MGLGRPGLVRPRRRAVPLASPVHHRSAKDCGPLSTYTIKSRYMCCAAYFGGSSPFGFSSGLLPAAPFGLGSPPSAAEETSAAAAGLI